MPSERTPAYGMVPGFYAAQEANEFFGAAVYRLRCD